MDEQRSKTIETQRLTLESVLVKELKSLGLNVELIETDPTVNRESA